MASVELSTRDREHYAEQGYVVLRSFFGAEELAPLMARFLEIVRGECEIPDEMLVMKDVMVVKGAVDPETVESGVAKVQDFHNDPVLFAKYSKNPRLLDLMESLLGPDLHVIHTMLINKPPGVDGRHPFHQDLLYFPFRPADLIMGTSTALEEVTRENGCLEVIPGSHKRDLMEHENPDWEHLNIGYFGVKEMEGEDDRVYLEMEPGDLLLFHPQLIHGAGRNQTDGFRRTILTHYASSRCEYLPGAESVGELRPYRVVRGTKRPNGL